ncbi:hypothetical protein FCR2A7T_17640 [Flavobacterium cauense R2A-7]|nr:hypothetical protein FCR2A7T_17640 [Flavobacterium cauense R2A-7]
MCYVVKQVANYGIGFDFFIKSIYQYFYVFSILEVSFHLKNGNGLENLEIKTHFKNITNLSG